MAVETYAAQAGGDGGARRRLTAPTRIDVWVQSPIINIRIQNVAGEKTVFEGPVVGRQPNRLRARTGPRAIALVGARRIPAHSAEAQNHPRPHGADGGHVAPKQKELRTDFAPHQAPHQPLQARRGSAQNRKIAQKDRAQHTHQSSRLRGFGGGRRRLEFHLRCPVFRKLNLQYPSTPRRSIHPQLAAAHRARKHPQSPKSDKTIAIKRRGCTLLRPTSRILCRCR